MVGAVVGVGVCSEGLAKGCVVGWSEGKSRSWRHTSDKDNTSPLGRHIPLCTEK